MKPFFYATLLLIGIASSAMQAQSTIDSLQRELSKSLPDSTRIAISDQLLRAYLSNGQLDEILEFTSGMLDEYTLKKNNYALQMAMIFRALILNTRGESEEAIRLSKKGVELSIEIGDSLQAAKHMANLGVYYQQQGKLDTALSFHLQSYPIYQRFEEYKFLSRVLNNIAAIYRQLDDYEKAISIYQESLAIREKQNDTVGIATSYMNMGLLYSHANQMDTAETYLLMALTLFKNIGKEEDIANCNDVLGYVYYNLGCYQEARAYLETAKLFYQNHPNLWYQTSNAFYLGSIDYYEGNYQRAERLLEEAIKHSKTANRWGDKQELYLKLSNTKHALGKNEEAFTALLTAFEHLDSIKEDRRLELTAENLARFEVLQKEKELALNQLELERRTRQRNMLFTGLFVLLLGAIGMFFFLRQRILIGKQKSELQKQRIQQLQQEKKLTALNAIIEGEEKERLRMAADLHDGLGGLLTSVKSHYTQFAKAPQNSTLQEKTSQLIDDACAEIRRISYNMAPRALVVAGLQGAVEDLCLSIKGQGLDCELEIIGLEEEKLAQNTVNIYRIIQELCNNAQKHAHAKSLFVQLFQKENFLSILIEDDGLGFDYAKAQKHKGLGLSSIESRVKAMNGEIHWYTEEGQGTSVSVRVPVEMGSEF